MLLKSSEPLCFQLNLDASGLQLWDKQLLPPPRKNLSQFDSASPNASNAHCRGLDGLLRSCKGLRCCCTSWPETLNSSANQTTRYHKVHQDLFILFNINMILCNMVQADCTIFSCCDEWRHLSTKVLVQSAIRSFPTLWVRTTARGPTYKRTLGLMIDWCIFKLRGSVHTHIYIVI